MLDTLVNSSNLTIQQAVLLVVFSLVVILISLSVHEFAHAFVAYKMGDDTPREAGRLTLNPFKHIDPSGFFWFLLIGVGWAKPVPINPLKFKKYKTGTRLVSVAGIIANFVLGLISAIIYAILHATIGESSEAIGYVYLLLDSFMMVNSALVLFNLLPFYPLDGFTFITTFMKSENKYIKFNMKYGHLVLLGIILVGSLIFIFDFYLMLIYLFIYWPITLLGVL